MKLAIHRISLDVHDAHSSVCLDMKREDTGRQIAITLTDGGFPYQISKECYAVFAATKPDGNIVAHPCEIRGNTILYDVRPQTTAVVGLMECEIKLYGADDKLITSPGFNILVSATSYTEGDEVESETEVTTLTHLISEATTVIIHVENVNARSEELIEDLEEKQELLAGKVSDAERYAKDANAAESEAKSYARMADASEDKASIYATAAYNHLQNAQTASSQAQAAAEKAKQSADQAAANVETALAEAMESGQFDGKNGVTYLPKVRSDGYLEWSNSQGAPNPAPAYIKGGDGKSAYQYAKDGGYTGTEEEFAELMANGGGGGSSQNAPVQSVNGKTGAVQLSAEDVKARPDNWTPTAEEVGARPNTWMPTAVQVGALPSTYTPPNQTAEQVGADPKGTATAAVSQHNTADDSHGDIRLELKAINDRLTAFFDSDNQTLDELSEIVAYITSNKSLIDAIATSKVSVADIINNLTTNVSNKPLSAAQGVVLKGLIDSLNTSLSSYQPKGDYPLRSELPVVPTKVSAFTNDAGYLTQHQDISGKADKTGLTLGLHTDGLVYLFVDGSPVGTGIELPTGGDVVGYVDADNNILISGNLADGTYILKYENEDGTYIDVGSLVVGDIPEPEPDEPDIPVPSGNLADPTSVDWLTDTRLATDYGYGKANAGSILTNYIPVQRGDVLRVKGLNLFGIVNTQHAAIGCYTGTDKTADATGKYNSYNKLYVRTSISSSASGEGVKADVSVNGDVYTYTILMRDGAQFGSGTVNYIRISAPLAEGYTANGVVITINEEIVDDAPTYKNLLPLAVNADGTPYEGGKGYKSGYKMSTTSGNESATTGAYCSGFMPITNVHDVIRVKNVTLSDSANINNFVFYDASKTKMYTNTCNGTAGAFHVSVEVKDGYYEVTPYSYGAATPAFFRFSCGGITDATIVTVNEEIV